MNPFLQKVLLGINMASNEPNMNTPTPPELCRLLADETRARLVLLLRAHGELCVCELVQALEQSQPKVSRHLAALREGGLLSDRRQGQWVFYQLHPELPGWVADWLQLLIDNNRDWLAADVARLQSMSARPGRSACQ